MKKLLIILIFIIALAGCKRKEDIGESNETDYGVFLGADPSDISFMLKYDEIVIDAQYYSKDEISYMKSQGKRVLSYINVGAIEDFRDYYNDYLNITLGDYENWEEERWVDVSSSSWQAFILDTLAPSILNKGVDGLFVDNCDVYYEYQTNEIFSGLEVILKSLTKSTYVSINGGDTFVYKYYEEYGNITDIMNAVNQETVFSKINWNKKNSFGSASKDDREYFKEDVEFVHDNGCDVYLLEYTKSASLIEKIDSYCKEKGFKYYASKTLELLAS